MFEFEKFTQKKVLAQAVAVALGLAPFLPGCGGGGGGSDGKATISAVGGNGPVAGSGGRVQLRNDLGTTEMLRSGRASVELDIAEPTMAFGSNKLTVSSDATVVAASDTENEYAYYVSANRLMQSAVGSEAALGTLYLYDGQLYQYGGDTSDDIAFTGIEVASGVTLTINNRNLGGDPGPTILLTHDVYNQGTIAVGDRTGWYAGDLDLAANNYFGAEGSTLTTAGHTGAPAGGAISMDLAGGFYNAGTLDTSAAAHPIVGPAGGVIDISAHTTAANSGAVNLSGGDGDGYVGGNAGELYLRAIDVVNSGAVSGDGGDGGYGGGRGGRVSLSAACNTSDGYGGVAYSEGALRLAGGNAASVGRGGNGGEFGLCAAGGQLVVNAAVDLSGGDGVDASAYGGNGRGGYVYLSGRQDAYSPTGDLLVSGNFNLDGGDSSSGYGGDGGELSAFLNDGDARLALLGFSDIDLSGGDGAGRYGGGTVDLFGEGVVRNEVDVRAHSGEGADGYGGGSFIADSKRAVENSGNIDVSGDARRAGGYISLSAYSSVNNSGTLKANGGDGTADVRTGGSGGTITMESATSAVTTSGGSYAEGGDATGAESSGGDGGEIYYASYGSATTYRGTLSVAGGSGASPGDDGCAQVDGTPVSGSCGIPK